MAATVALIALVLAGCSDPAPTMADSGASTTTARVRSTTSTTAGGTTPDPADGEPQVGHCLEPLTPSLTSAPQLPTVVPCTDPHGGEIVSVSTLDAGAKAAYPAVGDTIEGADAARTACDGDGSKLGEFDRFAGDNRLRSAKTREEAVGAHDAWIVSSLEPALFVPDPAGWVDGQRWVVCAAVLENSNIALSSYRGSARGRRVPGKLPEAFAWCRTDDQQGNFQLVGCDRPHSLEQVASFRVAGPDAAYPGNDPVDALAGELCPGLASAATAKRIDSAPTDAYGLSWTFPREQDWAQGDRTGRCYVRSLKAPTTGSFAAGTA
jgi:hypothetical protein